MDDMPWLEAEPTQENLLHFINLTWEQLQATFADLPPAQLTELTDSVGWSAADHLAHISAWEASLLALLNGANRQEAQGLSADAPHDETAINALLQRRSQTTPLSTILVNLFLVHTELLSRLVSMTDAELQLPYSHYQPNDPPHTAEPVVSWVVGNTISHYHDHTRWIRTILQQAH